MRKGQREVLEKYSTDLQDVPRIGIRLPTGAGKSLIALVILEAWRREKQPVAILAATIGLAEDLLAKSNELGISAVTIFGADGDAAYRQKRTRNMTWYKQHRAIGIFNYHSFLYSTEYKQETIPPRILVIDDANEFETVRTDFFTIRIDRDEFSNVYDSVIEILRPQFQIYPNLEGFLDRTSRQGAVEVIHFTHANDIIKVVNSHLPTLGVNTSFRLSYNRNKDRLPSFLALVTEDEIQLQPLLIPENVLKLSEASQIIFMGATLYQRGLLQKSFGIRDSEVALIKEEDLSDKARKEIENFGRRLILPIDVTSLLESPRDLPLKLISSLVQIHSKMLILANSKRVARVIQEYLLSNQINVINYRYFVDAERFKNSQSGALVCANRYIGLDFPGDTAKACIIVQLPTYLEPIDSFNNQILHNNAIADQKIANRLVQAFGRCNRLEGDEAIYYILDPISIAFLNANWHLSIDSTWLYALYALKWLAAER